MNDALILKLTWLLFVLAVGLLLRKLANEEQIKWFRQLAKLFLGVAIVLGIFIVLCFRNHDFFNLIVNRLNLSLYFFVVLSLIAFTSFSLALGFGVAVIARDKPTHKA